MRDIAARAAYRSTINRSVATMALFKSSPEKILTAAINARDKLRSRLADAEAAVVDLRAEAERLALGGGEDSELSAAEGKTRVMIDRTATFRAALSKAEADVARLEHERAEAADFAQREQTAASIELLSREVVEAAAAFVEAAAVLADCSLRASVAGAPEANGLMQFARAVQSEIPAGADLTAKLLRNHRAAVLARSAPALLAKPPEAYVAPVVTKPPTVHQVFTLHAIVWTDGDGRLQRLGKWNDVALPHHCAARGLRLGWLAPTSDPRRLKLIGQGSGHPEPHWCKDLDKEPDPVVEEDRPAPELHSAFEKPTIGQPFTLKVAR
jgi:hypothetical protein